MMEQEEPGKAPALLVGRNVDECAESKSLHQSHRSELEVFLSSRAKRGVLPW
jgi:hypothetical protein